MHPKRWLWLVVLPVALWASRLSAQGSFPHGVASGDVTAVSAVMWTRTTAAEVRLDVAVDAAFSQLAAQVVVTPGENADGTVTVDVTGLSPGTPYLYRFIRPDSGEASPVGMFRTAPAAEDPAGFRFIYTGDSHVNFQPFNLLRHAAEEAPDLWFWAGDTAYADSFFEGIPAATDRPGYQRKHREIREDVHLRNLLAGCPVWAQWDDHEVGNDYDGGELESEFNPEQLRAAYQSFFDYMPIRRTGGPGDDFRTYRSFRYGALAEFFLLDSRQYRSRDVGRDGGGPDPRAYFLPTLETETLRRLGDPSRSMLGGAQAAWLKEGLKNSTARWKFVLSSVPFTSLLFLPYDRWDGYAGERYDLLRFIDLNQISGVVLMAADIHANLHNPDVTYFLRTSLWQEFSACYQVPEFVAGPIGVDTFRREAALLGSRWFDTPFEEFERSFFFNSLFDFVMWRVRAGNDLRFLEPDRFTYLSVDVTPDRVQFVYRGITPDPKAADAPLVQLYAVDLPAAPKQGCAPGFLSPVCACLAAGLLGTGIRNRNRQEACVRT